MQEREPTLYRTRVRPCLKRVAISLTARLTPLRLRGQSAPRPFRLLASATADVRRGAAGSARQLAALAALAHRAAGPLSSAPSRPGRRSCCRGLSFALRRALGTIGRSAADLPVVIACARQRDQQEKPHVFGRTMASIRHLSTGLPTARDFLGANGFEVIWRIGSRRSYA